MCRNVASARRLWRRSVFIARKHPNGLVKGGGLSQLLAWARLEALNGEFPVVRPDRDCIPNLIEVFALLLAYNGGHAVMSMLQHAPGALCMQLGHFMMRRSSSLLPTPARKHLLFRLGNCLA